MATDHLDRFPDGVFFADLSPITDPSLMPSVIAQALVVREEPGRDLADTLADHIRPALPRARGDVVLERMNLDLHRH